MSRSRGRSRAVLAAALVFRLLVVPHHLHAETVTVYALTEIGLRDEPEVAGRVRQKVPRGTALEVLSRPSPAWLRVAAPGTGYALYVPVVEIGLAPPPALEATPEAPAPLPTPAPSATPLPTPAPAATPRPVAAKPAPSKAVATAEPPKPTPKEGGGKKLLWIGGGVALAAGGAAAVIAGAGSSGGAAPSAPPPAAPAPTGTVVFVSSDVPRAFAGDAASALMVGGLDGTITEARVSVTLGTSCGRDLTLRLAHPDGTEVTLLFQGLSGCTPQQFSVTFPIERAPYEPLSKLFGKPAGGAWTLRAGGGRSGELRAWSLALTTAR